MSRISVSINAKRSIAPPNSLGFSGRVLRSVALVTSAAMLWLTAGPAFAATVTRHNLPGHTRRLAPNEMNAIVGGAHTASVDDAPGSTYPWEGSVKGTNTGNGNKLTQLPIVGWKVKGGRLTIDFTLAHNSQSNHNSELGQKWTHSYDLYLVEGYNDTGDPMTSMHWGDDLAYSFPKQGNGSFNARLVSSIP